MKTLQPKSTDNILPLRTANEAINIPHEIAHPASKRYPELSDDPLADILFEFSDEEELGGTSTASEASDFIYGHNSLSDNKVYMTDSLSQMLTKISRQVKRLSEDTKRIKYYLDEVEDYLIED